MSAEEIKNFLVAIFGTILQVVIGFGTAVVFVNILKTKNNMIGKAFDRTKGLTNRARERAQRSGFYQRRDMARNQRKGEQQRQATEGYANMVTGEGWRSRRLRRRAGGPSAAGQNRAYVSGLGAIEKLESQETKDAEFVIEHAKVTKPGDLADLAAGRSAKGATGAVISGAGNEAIRLAAIRKIIAAQDAGAIEKMFMDPKVNQGILVGELQKGSNYSTSKGAGAHFVTMQAREPGKEYTRPEINIEAARAAVGLSVANLAKQDGPAVQSTLAGFGEMVIDPISGALVNAVSLSDRQKLWQKVQDIYANDQVRDTIKESARVAFDAIHAMPKP